MFDDRRDLFLALAAHVLAAAPFLATAWYLFESTRDTADADKRLLGLSCAVAAGIIVARPLAALVAEPTGSLFFPRRAAEPEPGYSRAVAQRKRGRLQEAMAEYEQIAAQFPAEVRAYVAMIEIAIVDLNDAERARHIVERGLAALPDEPRQMELLRAYRALERRHTAVVISSLTTSGNGGT
jgi:tetratricopeptide (TPR) repeat protein